MPFLPAMLIPFAPQLSQDGVRLRIAGVFVVHAHLAHHLVDVHVPGLRVRAGERRVRVARRLRGLLHHRQVVVVARHLHEVRLLGAPAALQAAVVQDLPKRADAKLGEVRDLAGGRGVSGVLRARARGAGGEAGRRAEKRERRRSETHWIFRRLGRAGGSARRGDRAAEVSRRPEEAREDARRENWQESRARRCEKS
jgi:hypothetical protein